MSDPLFIDDSFTRHHTIAAVPGLHPAVEVLFRPALPKERNVYLAKITSHDAEQIERYECDAIARYVKELDGQPVSQWKDKIGRISPSIRVQILNVVFGYTAAQEIADTKNSASG